MSRCGQEMCEFWTGDGCACAVFGIERPKPERTCGACEFNDHAECEEHAVTGSCCCGDDQ